MYNNARKWLSQTSWYEIWLRTDGTTLLYIWSTVRTCLHVSAYQMRNASSYRLKGYRWMDAKTYRLISCMMSLNDVVSHRRTLRADRLGHYIIHGIRLQTVDKCHAETWTSVSGPNKCTPVHVEYTHFYDFYVIDVLQHLYWFIKMSQIIELLHTVVYRSQWQQTVRERERERAIDQQ